MVLQDQVRDEKALLDAWQTLQMETCLPLYGAIGTCLTLHSNQKKWLFLSMHKCQEGEMLRSCSYFINQQHVQQLHACGFRSACLFAHL